MVAERLKELRTLSGLSQADIAQILNISRVAYSFYENGKRQPSLETLALLAEYYHVSTDYLLSLTDTPEPVTEFTKEEKFLIDFYRKADLRGKENIMVSARFEATRAAGIKTKPIAKLKTQKPMQ